MPNILLSPVFIDYKIVSSWGPEPCLDGKGVNTGIGSPLEMLAFLTCTPYLTSMIVTITSKGQITIPLRVRQKLHLNVGDQLEFDEDAPVLTARRVVDRGEWEKIFGQWHDSASNALKNHPWENQTAAEMIDDLRGGPAEPAPPAKPKK
jgi:AbrB family looped-hinge helix DNA binding protein